jgi:hypothetical protein
MSIINKRGECNWDNDDSIKFSLLKRVLSIHLSWYQSQTIEHFFFRSIHLSSLFLLMATMPISTIHTILNPDNYLLWKSQVLPVMRGYDLIGFIDGSHSSPPSIIVTDGVYSVNPTYIRWHQQNQLNLAWLFNSISASGLAQMLNATTSQPGTELKISKKGSDPL